MDSIFRSARLKLTLFYLLILAGMTLTLTLSFRVLAEHEYETSSNTQYGQVKRLFITYPWDANDPDAPSVRPDIAFGRIQSTAESAAHDRLNRDFIMINVAALVLGGVLSYWFAGRTLKPIEEAHELQARFAADASHELRTPLASMQVENEVFLRQKHFTEDEARAQLASNLEEVQRLNQLSGSLLALTQYGRGTLPLESTKVRPVVKEAVAHAHAGAEVRGVTFVQKVAPQEVLAHFDSVVQLIGIILDNAVKYGPENGTVTITGRKQGSQYALEIVDEGPGISETDLPHIFERLYRGDRARTTKAGGYGLGLALAHQIAQANHATIVAENDPTAGARFTIFFETSRP